MVKKSNILICDRCHTRIASRKCFICGDDLCNFCRGKSNMYIQGINLKFLLDTCKKCVLKLNKLIEENEDDIFKSIRETLTIDLRKRLILDRLEDKK